MNSERVHNLLMTAARKVKPRSPHVVMYVRVPPKEHSQIVKLAQDRGYPHTIASVAGEMISRGLQAEEKAC